MIGDGNADTQTAMISAVDDEIAENDEDFTVSIDMIEFEAISAAGTPGTIGAPSSQTATIMASDRK